MREDRAVIAAYLTKQGETMKLKITKIDVEKLVNTDITEIDFNDAIDAKRTFNKTVERLSLHLLLLVKTLDTALLAELDMGINTTSYKSFYEIKLI